MAVKGKKAQKQQQKPSPKLVKHQEEEENDDEEEEEDDDVEDEEQQEAQSDEEVAEQEEDDDAEKDDDEDEDDEKEEVAAQPEDDDDEKQTTIFVGHLSFQLTKKELDDFFGKAGEIQSSRIIPKRGYAFVTYSAAASVVEALKLDKQVLGGKAVHVERVKSKQSDSLEKKQLKRKLNKEENDKGAKKAKQGDRTVQMNRGGFRGGRGGFKGGRPKTAQHTNPNKKKNKPKPGAFVKA